MSKANRTTHGVSKLRTVSDKEDMLSQMIVDGRELVAEINLSLSRSEAQVENIQTLLDAHQEAVDANRELLIATQQHNLLMYAFTADPENNKNGGDCIDWLQKHPEIAEAFHLGDQS